MKALTLTQPWATLVAIGAKRFETRSWSTPYRGPLAIHAGKNLKPVGGEAGLRELCGMEPFREVLTEAGLADVGALPRGAIVATVELLGCHPTDDVAACGSALVVARITRLRPCCHERAFGDYSPGRFAWVLGDRQPLTPPVPARGKQGLWETEGEIPLAGVIG